MSLSLTTEEQQEIEVSLRSMKLIDGAGRFEATRLSGGVSCDVYRIDLGDRTICLKRALPKLRVKADWRAPATRSSSEAAWMRLARAIAPTAVPEVLGEDAPRHMFAMEFFPPAAFPVWKERLASGDIEPTFAAKVGATLARIHAATAGRQDIAEAFANDAQFLALRLDPFLLYVADRRSDIAEKLRALAAGVAKARIALMHGDASPKNILSGPNGPIFLDAETACYGDPAFDLAFCLNHLLLKCVWHPEWTSAYLESFTHLVSAYCEGVAWEEPKDIAARAAGLLPALLLARVDGKSPAEYLTDDVKRSFVRDEATRMLAGEPARLADIAAQWDRAVSKAFLLNS